MGRNHCFHPRRMELSILSPICDNVSLLTSTRMTTRFIDDILQRHLGSGSCGRADFDAQRLLAMIWKRFLAGAEQSELQSIVIGMQACWALAAEEKTTPAPACLMFYGSFSGLLVPYGKTYSHPQLLNRMVSDKPDADILLDVAEMFLKQGNSYGAGLSFEELGELARLAGSADSAKHFSVAKKHYERAGSPKGADHVGMRMLGKHQEHGIAEWEDDETRAISMASRNDGPPFSRTSAGAVQYERLYRFLHSK